LDYEQARRRRLQRLEQQRQQPAPADPLAAISPLPVDLRPFAADRFPEAVLGWAVGPCQRLLPAPVDPEGLDPAARRALASWFVAGRTPAPSPPTTRTTPSPRRRRGRPADPNAVQLSLWPSPQD
ncbi:MAG: hypothetical protein ACKOZW_11130, partial [Cyanobium sp.]